jgi:sugar lactone lactonase YvrE
MRRYLLPLLWVCAFVVAACSAVAPTLRADSPTAWDLGARNGASIGVSVQATRGFQTQQALPATVGNVDSYLFELRRTSDNGIAGSFTSALPQARFTGVPDGTYYLRADARNALPQSLVQGGPQNSLNTVTVASPNVVYSAGGGLTVTLNLLNGQGLILPVHITAPYTAGFGAMLFSPTFNTMAIVSSTVSSLEFRDALDGVYEAWAFAHDGAGIATPGVASGQATVSGNATVMTGNLSVVTGATVSPMGGLGIGDGGVATAAMLESPEAMCVSGAGDLILVEPANNRVRILAGSNGFFYGMMMTSGRMYTLVGNGNPGSGGDGGQGRMAQLSNPSGIATDAAGDVYIADTGNNRIRKLSRTTGMITAFAGDTAGLSGTADGTGATARFAQPKGLAFNSLGDLYVADGGNHRIRMMTPGAAVTTAAGTTQGWSDGVAGTAQFNAPDGLAVDQVTGMVYIADTGNFRIRTLTAGGTAATLAGDGTQGFLNATGTGARFDTPRGLVLDPSGLALYVADRGNHMVRQIQVGSGVVTTFAGTGSATFGGDGGPPGSAQLNLPTGVGYQGAVIYIVDTGNRRLRQVGINISTLAGNGDTRWAGDDCPAKSARFASVAAAAVDNNGHLLLAEEDTHAIRLVAGQPGTYYGITMVAGNVYSLAGLPGTPGTANGIGQTARFNTPTGLNCDSLGNVYVADYVNNQIRRIDPSGAVTTLVSGLNQPRDVVCSTTAQLYITERGANQLSKVPSAGGVPTSVLGSINWAEGLTIDAQGNVYIAANGNHTVIKVLPNGANTLVAGTGTPGIAGDGGPGFLATLTGPKKLAWRGGFLYMTNPTADRVRMLAPDGNIYRIAGNGTTTPPGEGVLAGPNPMPAPEAVAVDRNGRVFIASRTPAGHSQLYQIR